MQVKCFFVTVGPGTVPVTHCTVAGGRLELSIPFFTTTVISGNAVVSGDSPVQNKTPFILKRMLTGLADTPSTVP